MLLWTSSEAQDTVGADYTALAKSLESRINSRLEKITVPQPDSWVFIAILLVPELVPHYPEQMRFSKARSAIECKVSIDYSAFLNGAPNLRVDLIARALIKSIPIMARAKVSAEVQEKIRDIVALSAEEVKATLSEKH
jgi:hypothetical protein